MNLDHVYLAKGEREKALDAYKLSISNFDDPNTFIKGFEDDYQYVAQYGITKEEYSEIRKVILS